MKQVIDFIGSFLEITGNPTTDAVILFIIGLISFAVAWFLTGLLAPIVDYDSDAMRVIHWIIRVIFFMALFAFTVGIVKTISWLLSLEWWAYLIIGVLIPVTIAGIVYIRKCIKSKKGDNHQE